MHRRGMLWRCLGLLGVSEVFAAAPQPGALYRRPVRPVVVPADEVSESWRPLQFDALVSAPVPTAGKPSDVLLKGMLIRVPAPEGQTELKAYCLHCPHELCYVNLAPAADLAFVAPQVSSDHPLAVCPCHFSVFDPAADGARLTGPAPRGLYRFQLEQRGSDVQIVGVEAAALQ